MLAIELVIDGARDCVGTIYNVSNVAGDKMQRVGGSAVLCRHEWASYNKHGD
jgi:ribonuclease I